MKPDKRENIDFVLHDIRHPVAQKKTTSTNNETTKQQFPYRIFLFAFVIALSLIGIGYGAIGTKPNTGNRSFLGDRNEENLLNSARENEQDAFFDEIKGSFSTLKKYFGSTFRIAKNGTRLKTDGLTLALNGGGGDIVSILREMEEDFRTLDEIGAKTDSIFTKNISAGESVNSFYELALIAGGVADLLDRPGGGRIALLFENHSEIRPSGGFIGSYGVVTFEHGNITDISIDDIYAPDRDTELRVVPPLQLQSITGDWGARDANWFFDYPVSAEKVLQFLEGSNRYVHDGIVFDGAIALNSRVVSDVLNILGPIEVPERGIILTGENFLTAVRSDIELQREDWEPGDNSKEVLSFIVPTIIDRFQSLNSNDKAKVFSTILVRAVNKDVKIYFRDSALQNIAHRIGFDGSVYDIPQDFSGDYLAVVNANIAGGKSDIFIDQSIELVSQIKNNGEISNRLTIIRRHFGQDESEKLYRADNQNFTKIFTMPNATLININGVTPKEIKPALDYETEDYLVDGALAEVENTRVVLAELDAELYKESGKNVFAAWFSTPSGEERRLTVDYNAGSTISLSSGVRYTFIYEKQSGVESYFTYRLLAPSGFIWAETGGNAFVYESDSVPARLIFTLTLVAE